MRQRLALLLVLGAVALTLILLWGVQEKQIMRLQAPQADLPLAADVSATTIESETVTDKPQFSGEDTKGRKWQINAQSATQSGTVSDSAIGLSQATGWWNNGKTTLTGSADTGNYRPEQNSLVLTGNVVLQSSDTVIHTPAVSADMQTQYISGTDGVSLTRTLKTQTLKVQADAFTVDPATKKVTLKGQVKARLEPR